MILSKQSIKRITDPPIVTPFYNEKIIHENGMSYGLSSASYDIRIAEYIKLSGFKKFSLASTVEYFNIPNNVLAMVKDKSSWARQGVSLFNTIIDPGFIGFITLELAYHKFRKLNIEAGSPIAQIIFFALDETTETPYNGKYQYQKNKPYEFIKEEYAYR